MKIVGKLQCWWAGACLRMKFVRTENDGTVRVIACPRCGGETKRKVRAPRAPRPNPL